MRIFVPTTVIVIKRWTPKSGQLGYELRWGFLHLTTSQKDADDEATTQNTQP